MNRSIIPFLCLFLINCGGGDGSSPNTSTKPVPPTVSPPPVSPPTVLPSLNADDKKVVDFLKHTDNIFGTPQLKANGEPFLLTGNKLYPDKNKERVQKFYQNRLAKMVDGVCKDNFYGKFESNASSMSMYGKCRYEDYAQVIDSLLFSVNANNRNEFVNGIELFDNLLKSKVYVNSLKEQDKSFYCSKKSTVFDNYLYLNERCLDFPLYFFQYSIDNGQSFKPVVNRRIELPNGYYPSGSVKLELKDVFKTLPHDNLYTNFIDTDVVIDASANLDPNYRQHTAQPYDYSGERYDIVFLSDGFLESDRQKFIDEVDEFTTKLLMREELKPHEHFYVIHSYFTPSNERGADWSTCNNDGQGNCPNLAYAPSPDQVHRNDKDTYYDGGFWNKGSNLLTAMPRAIGYDERLVWKTIGQHVPFADKAMVITNSDIYGGAATERMAGATTTSGTDVQLHELIHTLSGIQDEYYQENTTFDDSIPVCNVNVCTEVIRDGKRYIPWAHWLQDSNYPCTSVDYECAKNSSGKPIAPGWFEGAYHHEFKIYRPTAHSIMSGEVVSEFGAVNLELWIKALYKTVPMFTVPNQNEYIPVPFLSNNNVDDDPNRVDLNQNPFIFFNEDSYAVTKLELSNEFEIKPIYFNDRLYRIEWFVNGVLRPELLNQSNVNIPLKANDVVRIKMSDISGLLDGLRFDDNNRRVFQTYQWVVKNSAELI
ncbi:hypothetical protein BIY22_19295 [Vibrio panuliri]|uniref:IgA Peptidase M64 n=1 Tax=Vibrio panuliri TaxID=1381081 RepID=A0A1Q9HHQ9_9VIBR|nr:M64 family metallopeptidase [Vibrio panuliri]OLQ89664.1 hypothetical protein BIY22_19295 [Vibrio panuliri]